MAYIALGSKAISDISFYSSVTQLLDEQTTTTSSASDKFNYNTPAWARIREGAKDTDNETRADNMDPATNNPDLSIDQLSLKLDEVIDDLKQMIQENDPQLRNGVEKFVNRYNKMRGSHSTAMLASSFHRFGSLMGGTITSVQGGGIRRGRRIPVQSTAAGRRKSIGKKERHQYLLEGLPLEKLFHSLHRSHLATIYQSITSPKERDLTT